MDNVAVTALVLESCTTCGGDTVCEHGGGLGDALATVTVPPNANASAAVRTIGDRIMPGW